MSDISDFFEQLVPILKTRDFNALNRLVEKYEDSNTLEVLYYIWLLYHPDGNPYLDNELTEVYEEVADIHKAEKYGKLYFEGIKRLCDQGNSEYMSRLGELYLEGCGCEINKQMSEYWFAKASENKDHKEK